MLKSIRIQNFKSYKDATFELSPFTVLIGANASGKSNAIEALRFMSILAQGQKLSSFRFSVINQDGGIRGSIEKLMYNNKPMELNRGIRGSIEKLMIQNESKCRFTSTFDYNDYNVLENEISLTDDELHITEEVLKQKNGKILYEIKEHSEGPYATDVHVSYDNFKRGNRKPTIPCSDQLAIFSQLTSPAPLSEKHEKSKKIIPEICQKIENDLRSMFFLDPVPAKMREYCARDKILRSNGENLSGVIQNLTMNPVYSHEERRANKKAILNFIRSLPEQHFVRLRSDRLPNGKSIVALTEAFGNENREYDASLLSDGTLRVLAIAVALLSVPENTTVVIEELDNGIHPSRAKTLLSRIIEVSKNRNLKILITTHNPALLNALPAEIVPNSVFCYRDPVDGSSKLVKISDIPNSIDLLMRGSLGDLLMSQQLDLFVKKNESQEEKKKKSLDWLNSLL